MHKTIKEFTKDDLWRLACKFKEDDELKRTQKHYYWVHMPNEIDSKIVKCYTVEEASNKALQSGRKVERIGRYHGTFDK